MQNIPKLEITQISMNIKMDEQTELYSYNGNETVMKKQTTVTHNHTRNVRDILLRKINQTQMNTHCMILSG